MSDLTVTTAPNGKPVDGQSPPTIECDFEHIRITAKGRRFSLRFKRLLWEANNRSCCYCGEKIATHKKMHVDHIRPISQGGGHEANNLACACPRCNMLKGAQDIEYLSFAQAFEKSPIAGIIGPAQALKLIEAGVELPVKVEPLFFEQQGKALCS